MKIIGIVPKGYRDRELLLQATPDEIRMILGNLYSSREHPDESMVPGQVIEVRAIYSQNESVEKVAKDLKDLPQTLRALADILTREVKVLVEPTEPDPQGQAKAAG